MNLKIKITLLILSCFTLLNASNYADIVGVHAAKNTDNYTFSVSIKSPDISCKQYANWWEILSEDGTLLYRRILWHSHPNEQPITRSGGPIAIKDSQVVYVRAHLNNKGYGGVVFKGNAIDGFKKVSSPKFNTSIEKQSPQATECWY